MLYWVTWIYLSCDCYVLFRSGELISVETKDGPVFVIKEEMEKLLDSNEGKIYFIPILLII